MLLTSIPLQYLHAIGTFQGLLLAIMLLSGREVTNASRVLGGWCLFMAFYFSSPLLIIHSDNLFWANFIGWGYFIPTSFGAFLYLYCRSAIIDKPFHLRDFLHVIPLLLCLILNQNYLLTSPLDKIALINSEQRDQNVVLLSQLLMLLQAFFYLGLSVQLILKFKKRADNALSSFNPTIFTWLWVLLSLYGVIWSIEMLAIILGGNYMLAIISDLLFLSLIYSISMAQWREPKLFIIDKLALIPFDEKEEKGKAKAEVFDSHTRQNLLDNILEFMQDKQPYLDNDITLDTLAKSIGLSSHHLSEVLNQQANKNFYQFVNEYRVNFICESISVKPDSKILDLAMAAGFSSKSTFNAVFKQMKGITPSQFRKELK
jgi:AraC-like DNA-binding protein